MEKIINLQASWYQITKKKLGQSYTEICAITYRDRPPSLSFLFTAGGLSKLPDLTPDNLFFSTMKQEITNTPTLTKPSSFHHCSVSSLVQAPHRVRVQVQVRVHLSSWELYIQAKNQIKSRYRIPSRIHSYGRSSGSLPVSLLIASSVVVRSFSASFIDLRSICTTPVAIVSSCILRVI